MAFRRRPDRRTEPRPFWARVRIFVKCAFGCDISAGQWAKFGLPRYGKRPAICEPCMWSHYKERRPAPDSQRLSRDGKLESLPESDR